MRSRLRIISLLAGLGVGLLQWTASAATSFNVVNNGFSAYTINGVDNATLTLTRGQTYTFTLNAFGHPFWITTARGAAGASSSNTYSTGVTNNGSESGTLTFVVPASAPATLFYQCGFHDNMGGQLNIVAPASVSSGGPVAVAALAGLLLVVALATMRRRRA
jgi:MYXO-CTERM domain-containing protein